MNDNQIQRNEQLVANMDPAYYLISASSFIYRKLDNKKADTRSP